MPEALHTSAQRVAPSPERLEPLSLTRHPFRLVASAPPTSTQVASRVQAQVEVMEALAPTQPLPDRQAAMKKVKTQVPDLAALVDFWWAGVVL